MNRGARNQIAITLGVGLSSMLGSVLALGLLVDENSDAMVTAGAIGMGIGTLICIPSGMIFFIGDALDQMDRNENRIQPLF